MIIECIDNADTKDLVQWVKIGQRFLVLDVTTKLNRQEISYLVLDTMDIYCSSSVPWNKFKVICDKMPSNWVFKYEEDINYGKRTYLSPNSWLDDSLWTFGFWEALYCGGIQVMKSYHQRKKNELNKYF